MYSTRTRIKQPTFSLPLILCLGVRARKDGPVVYCHFVCSTILSFIHYSIVVILVECKILNFERMLNRNVEHKLKELTILVPVLPTHGQILKVGRRRPCDSTSNQKKGTASRLGKPSVAAIRSSTSTILSDCLQQFIAAINILLSRMIGG